MYLKKYRLDYLLRMEGENKMKIRTLIDEISINTRIASDIIGELSKKYELDIKEILENDRPVKLIIKVYKVD